MTLDELGGSALYLLSDLSGGVTGEIHFVDSGYNIISMPRPEDLKAATNKVSSTPLRPLRGREGRRKSPIASAVARWNAGRAAQRSM